MEAAVYISLAVNFLLFLVLLYFDWSRRTEARAKDDVIKDLSLKLIARNPAEYLQAKGEPPAETKESPDPYVDLEDVEPEKLLAAEDKI